MYQFERFYMQDKSTENIQLKNTMFLMHDLKNSIGSTLALLNIIIDDYSNSLEEEVKDLINLIIKQLMVINNSMYENLIMLKGICLPTKYVSVKQVISEASFLIDANLTTFIEIPEDLPVINTNHEKILSIFFNILHNAIRHSKNEKGSIKLSCLRKRDGYEFEIKNKIFKGDMSLESAVNNNTGIGLLCAENAICELNGKLCVETSENLEFIVRFFIPQNFPN